jgi:chemotaxis protein methyltransferase CheR
MLAVEPGEDAVRLYAERDYAGTAELTARLTQDTACDPSLWILRVRALANQGALDAAGRACVAALDRHRTSPELTYLHAVLLAEAGQAADAAAAARRALYLDRSFVMAHLTLGAACARLGENEAAHRAFRNAELLLAAMPPAEVVPASDGEPAGRLVVLARHQCDLLRGRVV